MLTAECTVQRLSPADLAEPAYQRFAEEVFGVDRADRHARYCRWLVQDNPAACSGEPLPVYVYFDQGQPAGQVTFIPCNVQHRGERVRAGWCVDFHVRATHQRRGIGGALLRAVAEDFALHMTLGQTAASRALFVKHGWQPTGAMTHHQHAVRPLRCVAKKALKRAGFAHAATQLLRPPRATVLQDPRGVVVTPISRADQLDAALLGASRVPDGVPQIERSGAFLCWRYLDNPFYDYTIAHLRSGAAEAYAVWRVRDDALWRSARLVDFICPVDVPPAALRRLVAAVLRCVRAEGAEVFDCQTSDTRVLDCLPNGVFTTRIEGPQLLYAWTDGRQDELADVREWRLWGGDCDGDILEARKGMR